MRGDRNPGVSKRDCCFTADYFYIHGAKTRDAVERMHSDRNVISFIHFTVPVLPYVLFLALLQPLRPLIPTSLKTVLRPCPSTNPLSSSSSPLHNSSFSSLTQFRYSPAYTPKTPNSVIRKIRRGIPNVFPSQLCHRYVTQERNRAKKLRRTSTIRSIAVSSSRMICVLI